MRYTGILFDFDYTLGDSTKGIAASVNYGMEMLGREAYGQEVIRRTVGLSLPETYTALTGDKNQETASQFAAYFRRKADQVMVQSTELFPGVKETAEELKHMGRRLGIVTTKFHYRIDQILHKCGAEGIFEVIIGGEDVSRQKPDPQGVRMAAEQMHLSLDQILYVGDSLVDARTGMHAGVDFCGVTTGTTSWEEFQNYPHVNLLESLAELPSWPGL